MAQLQKKVGLSDISQILQEMGFQSKKVADNTLETSVGGLHYYVSELATDELSVTWIRAHFKFDRKNESELLRKANKLNHEFLFGRAIVDGPDTIMFDYHFSTTEVSREHVVTVLAFWGIELTKFGAGIFR